MLAAVMIVILVVGVAFCLTCIRGFSGVPKRHRQKPF